MKLEPFLDGHLVWGSWTPTAQADDGRVLAGVGEGTGVVKGDISGECRWFAVSRGREDGAFLPEVHGWIDTGDGSRVMFEIRALNFQFRAGYKAADAATTPGVLGTVAFRATRSIDRWVDDVVAVMEATELPDGETWRVRMFRCRGEPLR